MPTTISLPEKAISELEKISTLDEGVFKQLIEALRETKPTLTKAQLEKRLGDRVSLPGGWDFRSIFRPVFYLYLMKDRMEVSSVELAELVANSLASPEKLKSDCRERLQVRLELLLDLDDTLGITAKALDVMTEHERTYCRARILSDVRPVFSATGEPSAAVIIHNLQLGFHRGDEHDDVYIALDTDDLRALKKVIERAERKATAMETLLKKAGTLNLED